MTYPLGFERSARVLEQIRDEDIAPLIHIADTDPDVEKRRRALVTLGNAGILPPLHWVPLARTPLLAAPRKAAHFDPAFEADVEREARAAAAVLDASAPPRSEDVDLSGCGAPGKRHRYKGSPICLRCKRPDPRASSRKITITSPEQPANRKPDGCLEVGVGPVCEGPGAASFDAAAGSALGEPTGGTSTVLPSEPIPCTPTPISPASQGGSQTVGTVGEELSPSKTVPAALPLPTEPFIAAMACMAEGHACARREEVARVAGIGAPSPWLDDMDNLQRAAEALPTGAAPVATSFDDDATAERIIAKILDCEAQRARIAAQAEAMDRELANDIRGLAWRFGNPLEEWARRKLRGKAKSRKTLCGTVGFATAGARWSVEDAKAVEVWALEQKDPETFGRYGYTLDPAAVLAYAKATGEAIPGLKLHPEREDFYVKGQQRVSITKAKSAPALPEPTNPEEE